jgi:hypothetical protein
MPRNGQKMRILYSSESSAGTAKAKERLVKLETRFRQRLYYKAVLILYIKLIFRHSSD